MAFWNKKTPKEKTLLEKHADELVNKIWLCAQQKPNDWRVWGHYDSSHDMTALALESEDTLLKISEDGQVFYEKKFSKEADKNGEQRKFVSQELTLTEAQKKLVQEAYDYIVVEQLQRLLDKKDLLDDVATVRPS